MDFDDVNEVTWNWQELDRSLLHEPQSDISSWTDATPVKDYVDEQWRVSVSDDIMKEYEESRVHSSQAKRRRMLQFNDESLEPSAYLQTKEGQEFAESLLPEVSPWNGIYSEFAMDSNFEKTEHEYWLDELLNDTDMNSEDMTLSATSDVHFSISDFCEIRQCQEVHHIQKCVLPAVTTAPKTLNGKVIFKGRTSYIKTQTKRPLGVVYPFTFIKPCPIKGGMTLQDINRRILTPVPPDLPRSAISGKLVVGKTRIRTGGNGLITIIRTKG